MQRSIITLTTDFGTADGYVGVMKGVMLGIAPDARLLDISHQIAPQAVREAAYVLYAAYPFFPADTINLVVVDPGVGGERRPIALRTSAGTFVGPDNGVFSYVMAREPIETVVALQNPRYHLSPVSQTFHGRDIFAPAAAHLAAGVSIDKLGPPIPDPVTFALPTLTPGPNVHRPDRIEGEVLYVDHFGNVVSSIGRLTWKAHTLNWEPVFPLSIPSSSDSPDPGVPEKMDVSFQADEARVEIAGREIVGIQRAYADVGPGEVVVLVGSTGHLEVAVREGGGAQWLDVQPGDEVILRIC